MAWWTVRLVPTWHHVRSCSAVDHIPRAVRHVPAGEIPKQAAEETINKSN